MTGPRIPEATAIGRSLWRLEGHVPPAAAVLAVVVAEVVNHGPDRAAGFLIGEAPRTMDERLDHADALLGQVHHVWRKPDPSNEEDLVACSEEDPLAGPWTEVHR